MCIPRIPHQAFYLPHLDKNTCKSEELFFPSQADQSNVQELRQPYAGIGASLPEEYEKKPNADKGVPRCSSVILIPPVKRTVFKSG